MSLVLAEATQQGSELPGERGPETGGQCVHGMAWENQGRVSSASTIDSVRKGTASTSPAS